jgi:hypothetical protein
VRPLNKIVSGRLIRIAQPNCTLVFGVTYLREARTRDSEPQGVFVDLSSIPRYTIVCALHQCPGSRAQGSPASHAYPGLRSVLPHHANLMP